jgi:hypothetical protein
MKGQMKGCKHPFFTLYFGLNAQNSPVARMRVPKMVKSG